MSQNVFVASTKAQMIQRHEVGARAGPKTISISSSRQQRVVDIFHTHVIRYG